MQMETRGEKGTEPVVPNRWQDHDSPQGAEACRISDRCGHVEFRRSCLSDK